MRFSKENCGENFQSKKCLHQENLFWDFGFIGAVNRNGRWKKEAPSTSRKSLLWLSIRKITRIPLMPVISIHWTEEKTERWNAIAHKWSNFNYLHPQTSGGRFSEGASSIPGVGHQCSSHWTSQWEWKWNGKCMKCVEFVAC